MAKLGYLWLNEGNWNGVQVVPAAYVKGMTKAYSDFGGGDGYGMGMWTSDGGGFEASGAAVRRSRLRRPTMPSWSPPAAVLSMTILTHTCSNRWSTWKTRCQPTRMALQGWKRQKPRWSARLLPSQSLPLPELAATLAGKTFTFEPNPIDLKAVSLDFSKPEYAMMLLDYFSQDAQQKQPVGLDGIFRLGNTGAAAHGVWEDETTFLMDYYDIDTLQIRVRFDGDQAFLSVPGRVSEIIGTLVP